MKKFCIIFALIVLTNILSIGQHNIEYKPRILKLNGIVEFEQTEFAFPPKEFTRKIQVPGLIDIATPKINQYEEYFSGTHKPKYSWYKFVFFVDSTFENHFAILKILKSQFNTQIFINGYDAGTFIQCNTPIEADITDYIKIKQQNTLLIRIGDRAWLPKESATGFDREKFTDIPGIWDDVFITFSGPLKIKNALILPDINEKQVTIKVILDNIAKYFERNMDYSEFEYQLNCEIKEYKSRKIVGNSETIFGKIKSTHSKTIEFTFKLSDVQEWDITNPFLYDAEISVTVKDKIFNNFGNKEIKKAEKKEIGQRKSDIQTFTFGMREFRTKDKKFELNGKPIKLFGSTLTLNRFFEDKERANLPWDKEWVEKLFVKIPKSLGWNTFRVSIGLLPKFWYDLADQYGLLIQNEYPMWNLRGSESQMRKEYTDWVWTDGNHPSIIIWDALNEEKSNFVGKILIPELRELDPTRIWDAGWTEGDDMTKVEMKEIHWYTLGFGWWSDDDFVNKQREQYKFGNLVSPAYGLNQYITESVPLILNEYAWLWLERSGKNTAIRTYGNFREDMITPHIVNYEYYEEDGTQRYSNRDIYDYYLGENSLPTEKWNFQAYLLAIETEIARASNIFEGIISFPYLTNNNGYTGDWFKGEIKNLTPSPSLFAQYHAMKPFAAFIDLEDGRYLHNPKLFNSYDKISFSILIINDSNEDKKGKLSIKLINSENFIVENIITNVEIKSNSNKIQELQFNPPIIDGGYMILSELDDYSDDNINQISRRYLRIGTAPIINFPNFEYPIPKSFPVH